ncbi:MAG: calcium/sodium antiporter [Coxiellaceae bacterium]|nr:calcium/sodium antiporter [Coxiellaceae bacterium]
MSWFHVILELLIGIGLLTWGADRFITACSSIAKHFGMPPLLIGMLLVGFGTSFPELVVSLIAALKGNSGIAIGNAIGSNIANIGLVVGVTALVAPIAIHSQLLKREFPILVAVSAVVGLLFWDNQITRLDGLLLIALLIAHLYWMIRVARSKKLSHDAMAEEYKKELPKMSLKKAWIWWLVGLVFLFAASELLVDSASTIARWMHISDFIIGLTIVAVGTSLPELAATVVSAWRGEHDIAIGNVVGSNIFNLLAVLPMPALIIPGHLPSHLLTRDFPVMMLLTVLLWLFAFFPIHKKNIGRLEAGALLLAFVAYMVYTLMA